MSLGFAAARPCESWLPSRTTREFISFARRQLELQIVVRQPGQVSW